MIKIENVEVFGWEAAIRGMRNPMNSWDKSDSEWCWNHNYERCKTKPQPSVCDGGDTNFYCIGENDLKLMKTLSKAGSDHGKFLRMINVTFDITAPLYWWKEFDTYKVGTVANSCSTMHKIHAKEFTLDDFSCEHLDTFSMKHLQSIINYLNEMRDWYNRPTNTAEVKKKAWWQMIQLLPSSYNQKRTVQLNYQVLKTMYHSRKHHKLDEWVKFREWCETLPYFKEVCLDE